jgi:hypothetical protein
MPRLGSAWLGEERVRTPSFAIAILILKIKMRSSASAARGPGWARKGDAGQRLDRLGKERKGKACFTTRTTNVCLC